MKLRNENDFKLPRFQSVRCGKHSARYQGPYLWSKLSRAHKYSDNLNLFIKKIRQRDLAKVLEDSCAIVIMFILIFNLIGYRCRF